VPKRHTEGGSLADVGEQFDRFRAQGSPGKKASDQPPIRGGALARKKKKGEEERKGLVRGQCRGRVVHNWAGITESQGPEGTILTKENGKRILWGTGPLVGNGCGNEMGTGSNKGRIGAKTRKEGKKNTVIWGESTEVKLTKRNDLRVRRGGEDAGDLTNRMEKESSE